MLRNMSSGSSINLTIADGGTAGNGTFPSAATTGEDYDNMKQLRRDSSLFDDARSPSEIASSIYNDFSWTLARDLVISVACFLFGVHGPKPLILPLIGGLTMRPIPYQVTAAGDVLLDLTLANDMVPKPDATFNSERLWFISLWLPISTVLLLGSIFPLVVSTLPNNNSLHNVHAGVCTILVGIGMSELVTQTSKFYVGRLRPNFYAMCGFDKTLLQCTSGDEMEMEARMSFPSGHSSLSFCAMVCVVLFLLGRVGLGRNIASMVASGRGKILTAMSFTPLLLSFWCATSRLVDNWHHPSDIIAGTVLGSVSACISYHIWFPHILSVYAGVPLSVIRAASFEDGPANKVGSDYTIVEKSLSLPVYRDS
ncbi:hypothetical protein ACHAXT_000323 [Thalassiosira profunda]